MAEDPLPVYSTPKSKGQNGEQSSSGNGFHGPPNNMPLPTSSHYIISSININCVRSEIKELLPALEAKRKLLDDQIKQYIRERQEEYLGYEKKLLKMNKDDLYLHLSESENPEAGQKTALRLDVKINIPSRKEDGDFLHPGQHEAGDRTPVHEREMELSRLVTSFLPLLEGRPSERRELEETDEDSNTSMPQNGSRPETVSSRKPKESRRKLAPVKKSALRKSTTASKGHRKRVSLVIDDKVFRPSESPEFSRDIILDDPEFEPPQSTQMNEDITEVPTNDHVTHPTTQGTEPSNSAPSSYEEVHEDRTPSPDEAADPRGIEIATVSDEIPEQTIAQPSFASTALSPQSPAPHIPYSSSSSFHDQREMPQNISDTRSSTQRNEDALRQLNDDVFTTYVGGIDGSGVDEVDQASLGYPASLGASYMEQFAALRAAGARMATSKPRQSQPEIVNHEEHDDRDEWSRPRLDDIDDDLLGEMEGL